MVLIVKIVMIRFLLFLTVSAKIDKDNLINERFAADANDNNNSSPGENVVSSDLDKINPTPVIISASVFVIVLIFFVVVIYILLRNRKLRREERRQKKLQDEANKVIEIIRDEGPITHDVYTWSTNQEEDDPFNAPSVEDDQPIVYASQILQDDGNDSDFYLASDTPEI